MAGLKEIKRRIRSVQNTKKITYAMKLVSAAKLRKAQDSLIRAREYTEAMEALLQDLIGEPGVSVLEHPLLRPRPEVRRLRLIVIGGRRGLSGAYNSNLNRAAEALLIEKSQSAEVETVIIGKKPADYFRRRKYETLRTYENLSDDALEWPIAEIFSDAQKAFLEGEIGEAMVIYTRFRSALSVQVQVEPLLPLTLRAGVTPLRSPTIYEPSLEEIFAGLVPKYLQAKLLLAGLESKASEQGSRMTAMDAATENAGELIERLTLMHNKLRQAGITSDILDIIGGSENIET